MNWLHRQVTARPSALALQSAEQALNWSNLGTRVRRVAAALRGVGVQPNDRVAVLIEDNLQFAVTILAVGWLGATLIPLNRRLTDGEISWILQDIDPHLLVIDHTAGTRNIELADKPFVQVNELTLSLDCEPVDVDEHGVAVIMYTSGTTGPPKPVPLTWENIKASAAASAFNIGVHRDDVWLCVIPLYHIGGLSILYRGVLYGTATLILDRFDAGEVIAMLPRVTIVSLVPTMLHRLIQAGMEKQTDSRVRAVLLGGGPADQDAIAWCTARGLPVLQTYGMTEACSQVTTMPIDAVNDLPVDSPRWASAGLPVLGATISIRSSASQTVPAHTLGNIFVRGPMVTHGYLDRPTENSRRFVDGWFDTGDFGYVDEQGYLYVKVAGMTSLSQG
ncbi:MAG: AMP-binding protein [bacterium]